MPFTAFMVTDCSSKSPARQASTIWATSNFSSVTEESNNRNWLSVKAPIYLSPGKRWSFSCTERIGIVGNKRGDGATESVWEPQMYFSKSLLLFRKREIGWIYLSVDDGYIGQVDHLGPSGLAIEVFLFGIFWDQYYDENNLLQRMKFHSNETFHFSHHITFSAALHVPAQLIVTLDGSIELCHQQLVVFFYPKNRRI